VSDTIHIIRPADAPRIARWLRERGGIAVWPSVNLSNPDGSWTTPAQQADGTPTPKPTWQAGDTPAVITEARRILVEDAREVKRFYVGVRVGAQGRTLKLTDGASRRVRRTLDALNATRDPHEQAWYVFDYARQHAVFSIPLARTPLGDWVRAQGLTDLLVATTAVCPGRGDGQGHATRADGACAFCYERVA